VPSLFHPIQQLHADTRGNIAILFLLILFCLLGVLGLVWNTAELATRRQALQTAADTSAHAAATWVSRCTNLVAAQNMMICQDASAEIIWRAIIPTDQRVRQRLEREADDARRMLNGGDPQYNSIRTRMLSLLLRVDNEYTMATSALQSVRGLSGQAFTDPQQGIDFRDSIRQADDVLSWVNSTYVNGQPGGAGRPGPPGPAGEGLRQLVAQWSPPPDPAPFLREILASLQQQLAVLVEFESRTAPALAQNVPAQTASHAAEVFATQQQMVQQITQDIREQFSSQADFYNARLTVATTGRGAQPDGPADILAPLVPADDASLTPEPHFDRLRNASVQIDPINVHTDAAAIVWPSAEQHTITIGGRTINFTIDCNIPGGWGHMYAAPIKRYVQHRVGVDQQELRTYMQRIDDLRRELAERLRQLRGLPANENITGLPSTLQDATTNSNVPVPPRLSAPDGATDELRAQVTLYNQHAGAYTGTVRSLANTLRSWARYYDRFTNSFAVSVWHDRVAQFRAEVLKRLGEDKQFMVLATYRLRPIPDWARGGMRTSAEVAIRDRIVSRNIGRVQRAILSALVNADPSGAGAGFLDPTGRNQVLSARYSQQASRAAFDAVNQTAARVAPLLAAEWISRPWPYEITPPEEFVPPSRGVGDDDRQTYFTLLAAARPTDALQPRFVLPAFTQSGDVELLAFAQAETFNWMEFHSSYGGSERFDEVSPDPNAYFIGAPLPWRLSTIGGWSWQSRLAVGDALSASLTASPELQSFFTESAIPNNDPDAMETLTLH
jgi:hypothetical protein